jgi:hypothetical protein
LFERYAAGDEPALPESLVSIRSNSDFFTGGAELPHEKRIEIRRRDLDSYGRVNQAFYLTFAEEVLDDWFQAKLGRRPDTTWDYVAVQSAQVEHPRKRMLNARRSLKGPLRGPPRQPPDAEHRVPRRTGALPRQEIEAASVTTIR